MKSAKQWEEMAEMMRVLRGMCRDPVNGAIMEGIARDYEALASGARQIEALASREAA